VTSWQPTVSTLAVATYWLQHCKIVNVPESAELCAEYHQLKGQRNQHGQAGDKN
jgi:hypothetical protein